MRASQHPHRANSSHGLGSFRQAQPSGQRWLGAVFSVTVAFLLVMGTAHAKDPGTPTAEHLGLTPAYLQGDWCQTHIQFPKERAEENTHYRWDPDGTYATRGAPTARMQSGFFYLYKPEGKIKLATMAGFLKVKSVKPDGFVLHLFGDWHFARGVCQ
jgi:hypothetical protein